MADFNQAIDKTLRFEGGYVNDPQDPGGETYKGVARKANSKWEGWIIIDAMKRQPGFPSNLDGSAELQKTIRLFYEANYWDKVRGDEIKDQDIAECIFDFAVNAGPIASIKLAQLAIGVGADGVMGATTLEALNRHEAKVFIALFTVNKIARYVSICERRKESRKFFYGWIKRALEAA